MRAHLLATFEDTETNEALAGASVTVYQQGTTTPITETIYANDDTVDNATLSNPLTADANGKIEFYLAAPKRVKLLVELSGYDDKTFNAVDVIYPQVGTLQQIKEGGTPMTARNGLDFAAADFDLTDDAVNNDTGIALATTVLKQTIADAKGDSFWGTGADAVARKAAGSNGQIIVFDSAQTEGVRFISWPVVLIAAFSKVGTLTVGAGAHRFYIKGQAWTITHVIASVGTQPTGASILIDVNKNGTTIFTTQSNRPTIAVSTNKDDADAVEVTALAVDDYLSVDIDQIGSTIAGSDLTVEVFGRPTL